MVSLALLNNLCLFSFVNIQPKNTSIGSKNALPKLCIAIFLMSGAFPAKSVVLILSSFLPIDCPVVDSKYVQYAKKSRLCIANLRAVKIPPVLRPSTNGEKEVGADGGSVGEVLRNLVSEHPATQAQLFGENGDLNRY